MAGLYLRHEIMRNETMRLKTLFKLRNSVSEKKTIANFGFYFDQNISELVCFSCNLLVPRTTPIHSIHRKHYRNCPDCPFLVGYDVSISSEWDSKVKGRHDIVDASYFNRDVIMVPILESYSLNNPPYFYDQSRSDNSPFLDDIDFPDFIPGSGSTKERFDTEKFFLMMRSEAFRLQTFKIDYYNYPVNETSAHWPEMLSKYGFIYTLTGNNIQCAMCRIVLGEIFPNCHTDFIALHERYSPLCPWTLGDRRNNIPTIQFRTILSDLRSLTPISELNENDMITDAAFSDDDDDDVEIVGTFTAVRNTRANGEQNNVQSNEQPTTTESTVINESRNDLPSTSQPESGSQQLAEETTTDQSMNEENNTCKCCFLRPINCVHQCGHVSICTHCSDRLTLCIICRQELKNRIIIYFN